MESVELDVLGQRPGLSRLYTQLCFCFAIPDTSPQSQSTILGHLRHSLEKLTLAFPWIPGQVIRSSTGIFEIQPYERLPRLLARDLRTELPPMQEFRKDGFPFRLLDENVIASRGTLPDEHDTCAPVFEIQANFIQGGLLLVFNGQHNCIDMAGEAQMIYLFSKACCGDPFTTEEMKVGNQSRSDIIPLLSGYEGVIDKTDNQSEHQRSAAGAVSGSPESFWAYFGFNPHALTELKSSAMQHVSSEYISTDDVVSALIWRSVTRARLPRFLGPAETRTTFARQVNTRSHLRIPATYPGVVVHKVNTAMKVDDLLSTSLGEVASQLRGSLREEDLGYRTRVEATELYRRLPSGTIRGGTGQRDLSTDIVMSSWAKEKCYDFDFGLTLGKAEAVRRPRFA
ncbi:hypothetical protein BAUCODRAFT_544077 [Baudoinia panamericana UAMH 10762]|uniref:Trichothecene 3-O-acetyltransferase-like N-terminal domain-containing protein n=1 Tax=Baudoinia panamericana (strain UAMH 10762) TaxID=717646 RepID=M2N9P2_BAUPA|nr:uncharacterized protein BAUCODRAFT_544077 [Baudoinia panamericana UAMH 10762]EMC95515.1 hypothetical protein BAUCODRAFT_544077 [Baudoinia panamericana UAMH 10762]